MRIVFNSWMDFSLGIIFYPSAHQFSRPIWYCETQSGCNKENTPSSSQTAGDMCYCNNQATFFTLCGHFRDRLKKKTWVFCQKSLRKKHIVLQNKQKRESFFQSIFTKRSWKRHNVAENHSFRSSNVLFLVQTLWTHTVYWALETMEFSIKHNTKTHQYWYGIDLSPRKPTSGKLCSKWIRRSGSEPKRTEARQGKCYSQKDSDWQWSIFGRRPLKCTAKQLLSHPLHCHGWLSASWARAASCIWNRTWAWIPSGSSLPLGSLLNTSGPFSWRPHIPSSELREGEGLLRGRGGGEGRGTLEVKEEVLHTEVIVVNKNCQKDQNIFR